MWKCSLEVWEASLQEFRKAYVDMQQRIAQAITESDRLRQSLSI